MNVRRMVKEALQKGSYEEIALAYKDAPAEVLRNLQMHVYGGAHDTIRWYAIDFLGRLAQEHVETDKEAFRNIIRRFIWQMCEESANVPWAAPEVCLSIIARTGTIFYEFIGPVFYHAGLNEICHAGLFWGLSQLDDQGFERAKEFLPDTLDRLQSPDIYAHDDFHWVLGFGCYLFAKKGYAPAIPYLEKYKEQEEEIIVYDKGTFTSYTIKELVEEAIQEGKLAI